MVYKARTFFFTKGIAKNMDQNEILYKSKLKIKQLNYVLISRNKKRKKLFNAAFELCDEVYTECPTTKDT